MRKRNLSLHSAPGAGSSITAKQFFINNTPEGIVDATVLLDYVGMLSPNGKQKYAYFWDLLKNGNRINGMLMKRPDKNNLDYAWADIDLVRGNAPFKVILLSDKMLDFLVKYQRAEVSIRFTLQELIDEALKIESGTEPSL
jgi:hypothetical protein